MSEQLFDDYFIEKTSRNIKGSKLQCPEVKQKKLKETRGRKASLTGDLGDRQQRKAISVWTV